jgi:hypothetical protein
MLNYLPQKLQTITIHRRNSMSTENINLTEQKKEGRNPIILIAGLAILISAFVFLFFGGRLFGDDETPQPAMAELAQGELTTVLLPEGGPPLQVGDQPYEFALQGALPASVFINPDGEVSVIHRGAMTRGQLDSFLDQTLSG